MITINKPFIEVSEKEAFLKSVIIDDYQKKEYSIWYSVNLEYKEYLTHEVADCFVLTVLQLAMKSHQGIKINANISSLFYENLTNSVMPMLSRVIPDSIIVPIEAENYVDVRFDSKEVGCGCSLGVDSFASFLSHGSNVPKDLQVSCLALFNTGQFGDKDLEAAERDFFENVEKLKPFAEEIGIPLVGINTNLNVVYKDYNFPLLQRFAQTTISAVLSVQKLFRIYIYASSYPATKFKFSPDDISYCESALLPLLSTQNTQIILSNPMWTRVEKTNYIANNTLVKKWLNVCWANQLSNMIDNSSLKDGKIKPNCGKCGKCLRTLFTLELLGVNLKEYETLFDLDEYNKNKNRFIIKCLATKKRTRFHMR